MTTVHRSDIDGLRAIAVCAVVGYHLVGVYLPGGYLGVDIFFVLSGYLITSIIWREIGDDSFSIVKFYDRRVRRIIPALLAVLFFSTVVATAILLPSDLMGYAKSLLSTLVFGANFYFWRDTNYFSPNAQEKPLLHLWSLGVEEQFYILFPLVLLVVARFYRKAILPICIITSAVSLGLNILMNRLGGQSPAFFFLPTRAWELGVGATIAVMPPTTKYSFRRELYAIIGAALVVIGIADSGFLANGVPIALAPVFGVALIVHAGTRQQPIVNRALSWRPLVFVGLISYSLYLWHWPIIVFGQYYLVRDFSAIESVLAVALMSGTAILSWRYVERPFRDKTVSIVTVRYTNALMAVILGLVAVIALRSDGFPQRLSARAGAINSAVGSNYRCPISKYLAFGASRACAMYLPSGDAADAVAVLLGNSHAQMYSPVWETIFRDRGMPSILVPLNTCLPTVDANIDLACNAAAKTNLTEVLKLPRVRTVVVALDWAHAATRLVDANGHALPNDGDRVLISALDKLVDRLRSAGKHVVLIGPIAAPGWEVASILSRQLAFGRNVSRPPYLPSVQFFSEFKYAIDHFSARSDESFARPDLIQCPADRCYYLIDGKSLFSDSSHIAQSELFRFKNEFETALDKSDKST